MQIKRYRGAWICFISKECIKGMSIRRRPVQHRGGSVKAQLATAWPDGAKAYGAGSSVSTV